MKPLECNGKLILSDYVDFARFNVFKGKYFRIKIMAVPFVAALFCIFMIYLSVMQSTLIYGFIAVMMILMLRVVLGSFKTKGKQMYAANAKYARAVQSTLFGKNGFITELKSEGKEAEHNEYYFDEVQKIYFAPNAVYVYMNKKSVFILPKRNFKVTIDQALSYLSEYVPAEKLVICA